MKKILSTVLTLTMLTLPLAVLCSASDESYCDKSYTIYDNDNNYIICDNTIYCENDTHNYIDDKDNKVSTESQTNSQKPKRSFLKKAGSFCLKTLLVTSALIGGAAALYKWSPNGEATLAVNRFFDNYVNPSFGSAYNTTTQWFGSARNTTTQWFGSAYNATKQYVLNHCVQKGKDNKDNCEKTLGTWFNDTNNAFSKWWNNFINHCALYEKDKYGKIITDNNGKPVCAKTLESLSNEILQVLKNNLNPSLCDANDTFKDYCKNNREDEDCKDKFKYCTLKDFEKEYENLEKDHKKLEEEHENLRKQREKLEKIRISKFYAKFGDPNETCSILSSNSNSNSITSKIFADLYYRENEN